MCLPPAGLQWPEPAQDGHEADQEKQMFPPITLSCYKEEKGVYKPYNKVHGENQ